MTSSAVRKIVGGGALKLEGVQVICPTCGQRVEVVARDSQVKGYCVAANQYVDFPVETQSVPVGKHPTDKTRAKLSAAAKKRWQDPDYRDKQIATHTGKPRTAETKAKISAALTRWHNRKGVKSND